MNDTGISVSHAPVGRPGMVILKIALPDGQPFTDRIDIVKEACRAKFLKRIAALFGARIADALAPALEKIANSIIAEVATRHTSAHGTHGSDHKRDPHVDEIELVDGELPRVVAALETVLGESGLVYAKGQVLVTPLRLNNGSKAKARGGIARAPGALISPPVGSPRLVEIAMEKRRFTRRDSKANASRYTNLPIGYARHVLERKGHWPTIPPLRGLAECPLLRPDGTVAQAKGYDPQTQYLIVPSAKFPPVPKAPSLDEARAAVGVLKRVIARFPYVDSHARGVALASMLTPLARAACRTAPLIGFDAPKQGTGKTLSASIPWMMFTGRPPAVTPPPEKEEEVEKLLMACLVEGDPIVVFDNIEQPLRSKNLAAALSAEEYKGRLLGKTETATVPVGCSFFATGNNLTFLGDLASRAIICRLDSKKERPEEREFAGDLKREVLALRAHLVCAGLTLLRWWALESKPLGLRPFGRFEDWSRIVREPLVALEDPEVGDPCATRERIIWADPDAEQTSTLLGVLESLFHDRPFTSKEATQRLEREGSFKLTAQELGYKLRHIKDRPEGGRILVEAPLSTGDRRWRVVRWGGCDGGDSGDPPSPREGASEEEQ